MYCYVYKGEHKDDHYLYLGYEFDAQSLPASFPEAILTLLGELSLVVEFELEAERKLPQAEAQQVIDSIASQGFYLQMPKKDMHEIENQFFN